MDWLSPMFSPSGGEALADPLLKSEERLDQWLGAQKNEQWDDEEALTATELVALFNGHPGSSVSERIMVWAHQKQKEPSQDLLAKALQVVERVLGNPEADIYAVWKESESFQEWYDEMVSLKQRLQQPYQVLAKIKTYAETLTLELDDVQVNIDDLTPPTARLNRVYIDLSKNFEPSALEKISRWLAHQGVKHLRLGLSPRTHDELMAIAGDPLGAAGLQGGTNMEDAELWNRIRLILSQRPVVEGITAILPLGEGFLPTFALASSLKRLVLRDDSAIIDDFGFLRQFPDLISLSLQIKQFAPTEVFTTLPQLVRLSLKTETVVPENPILFRLPKQLRHLHLNLNSKVLDLSFLHDVSELEHFDLSLEGELVSPAPLEKLPKLEFLELWHIQNLNSLEFVRSAPNLKHIRLGCLPQITNLKGLEALPLLERLWVFYMTVQDFSVMTELSALRIFFLEMAPTFGEDETPTTLPPLPQLQYLKLNGVILKDVSVLKEGTNLKEILLHNVEVPEGTDMTFLLNLPALQKLRVSRCDFGPAFESERAQQEVNTETWPYPAPTFLPGDILSDGEKLWSGT